MLYPSFLFHGTIDYSPPESSVLGFPVQLFPCQPTPLDVCLEVPAPGVGPASVSCALEVSPEGLPGNAGIGFQECVADPSPSSSLDLLVRRLLDRSPPEIIAEQWMLKI